MKVLNDFILHCSITFSETIVGHWKSLKGLMKWFPAIVGAILFVICEIIGLVLVSPYLNELTFSEFISSFGGFSLVVITFVVAVSEVIFLCIPLIFNKKK